MNSNNGNCSKIYAVSCRSGATDFRSEVGTLARLRLPLWEKAGRGVAPSDMIEMSVGLTISAAWR